MKFGSLFSGIGGIDLGLTRAGMACEWQIENDPFCQKILSKHWPDTKRFSDIREVDIDVLNEVDLIAGGFPCQDISNAGDRKGINGKRSGLWQQYVRILRGIRPRFGIVENVGALTIRGLQRVLGDIHESGYDAEWRSLSASLFGFPHKRERLFIVAHNVGDRLERRDAEPGIMQGPIETLDIPSHRMHVSESFGLRTINGVSNYVDRIRGLGNAVIPQIVEWIGRRIIAWNCQV